MCPATFLMWSGMRSTKISFKGASCLALRMSLFNAACLCTGNSLPIAADLSMANLVAAAKGAKAIRKAWRVRRGAEALPPPVRPARS